MLENYRASDQEYNRSSEDSDISEHMNKICNDLSSAALKENCAPADYRLTSADTEFYRQSEIPSSCNEHIKLSCIDNNTEEEDITDDEESASTA